MADETKRIIDLTENSVVTSGTYIPTDHTTAGTNKITAGALVSNSPVSFTSGDAGDNTVTASTAWTTVAPLSSGESGASLFNKVASMFKNTRILKAKVDAIEENMPSGGGSSGGEDADEVVFSSADVGDSNVTTATGWTSVDAITSGSTHATLFNRISTMFKNIRWLYKMLGTTDISSLSTAGTVTGALAKLNTERNYIKNENVIDIPDDTTSFTIFDDIIDSLGAFEGKTFQIQVGANVVLDGVSIGGGRKLCQVLRHSTNGYAVISMMGWIQNDRYYLVKNNGTWSCTRLPYRAEIDALNTNSLQKVAGTLSSSNDLNSITTPGIYSLGSSMPANIPTSDTLTWSLLIVTQGNNFVTDQMIIRPVTQIIYIREQSGNPLTWTNWVKMPTRTEIDALNTNLYYHQNETAAISRCYCVGCYTNSGGTYLLRMFVPLSKPINNQRDISDALSNININYLSDSVTSINLTEKEVSRARLLERQNGVEIEIYYTEDVGLQTSSTLFMDFRGSITL